MRSPASRAGTTVAVLGATVSAAVPVAAVAAAAAVPATGVARVASSSGAASIAGRMSVTLITMVRPPLVIFMPPFLLAREQLPRRVRAGPEQSACLLPRRRDQGLCRLSA